MKTVGLVGTPLAALAVTVSAPARPTLAPGIPGSPARRARVSQPDDVKRAPNRDLVVAAAPDGTVSAMDTTSIVRVSPGVPTPLDFTKRKVPGIGIFLPNGIALAQNGDLYLDSDPGNGWGDRAMLLVVHPGGQLRVLWAAPR